MKMFKLVTIMLFVITLCTSAIAGPECKTYTMLYEEDTYTLDFHCETAGIGAVDTLYNINEYVHTYIYLFNGVIVMIPCIGYFEYTEDALYYIVYDYIAEAWYDTGLVFFLVP